MKEFTIPHFGGINQRDPLDVLRKQEATDGRNFRLTKEGLKKRLGTTEIGSGLDATTAIREMASVAGWLVAVQGVKLWKWKTGAFASARAAAVNATSLPKFVEFPGAADYTVSPATVETGTITAVGNNGLSITAVETYTPNQYVGYFCKLTSGTGRQNQLRVISANTATELFFSESFDPLPEVGDTYSVLMKLDNVVYFFDGVGNSQKNLDSLATTGWTDISTAPAIQSAAIKLEIVGTYRNRLVGAEKDSPRLWVSSLFNGEDFRFWFEPGNPAYDIEAIETVGDQLVVHKGDGGVYITEGDDPSQWEWTERATNFGAINDESSDVGENIHFFVSNRGIEWFNTLETNLMEGHRALSSYRLPVIADGTYVLSTAKGLCFDAKYYCALKATTSPSLTTNRVFIFDIGIYLQRKIEGVESRDLPFLIDSGYIAESMVVHDGQIYFGGAGAVYEYSGTTDYGSAITSYWTKSGIDIGMPDRNKSLRKVFALSSGGSSSTKLDITDTTDIQTKSLQQTTLDTNAVTINGKRTKGRQHSIKLTLTNLLTASIEKVRLLFELGHL